MPPHKNKKEVRALDRKSDVGVEMSHTHESIMPPAEEMERLESLSPGITKEYMEMAKAEQAHFIKNDMEVFNKIVNSTNIGRGLGFSVVLMINFLAAYMVSEGYSGQAVALVISEMLVGFGIFYNTPTQSRIKSPK